MPCKVLRGPCVAWVEEKWKDSSEIATPSSSLPKGKVGELFGNGKFLCA